MGKDEEKKGSQVESAADEEHDGVEPDSRPSGSNEEAKPSVKREGPQPGEEAPADEKVKKAETESEPSAAEGEPEPPSENEEQISDEEEAEEGIASPWEKDLAAYPLREPREDPRWATRTVKIWIGFTLASLVFILTLLVLGAIYD